MLISIEWLLWKTGIYKSQQRMAVIVILQSKIPIMIIDIINSFIIHWEVNTEDLHINNSENTLYWYHHAFIISLNDHVTRHNCKLLNRPRIFYSEVYESMIYVLYSYILSDPISTLNQHHCLMKFQEVIQKELFDNQWNIFK